MTDLSISDILLYSIALFLAAIGGYKSAEHSARPAVKQALEAVSGAVFIVAAVFVLWALVRTW